MALVVLKLFLPNWGDDVEPPQCLGEAGLDIEVPVGSTVANHKAREVHVNGSVFDSNLLVVNGDLPSEERNVDTGITLT